VVNIRSRGEGAAGTHKVACFRAADEVACWRVRRRSFLIASFIGAGLLALAFLPLRFIRSIPGQDTWADARLSLALRELVPPSVEPPDTRGLGWSREYARERLVGDLSYLGLVATLRDPQALRAALAERERDDFREDRVRALGGWLLSETELAVAVLLSD